MCSIKYFVKRWHLISLPRDGVVRIYLFSNILYIKSFFRLIDNMIHVREDPDYIRNTLTYRPIMIEKVCTFIRLIE